MVTITVQHAREHRNVSTVHRWVFGRAALTHKKNVCFPGRELLLYLWVRSLPSKDISEYQGV
uniref:Uncharacterized protein n=1 Tax=Anguilla anguilla TaxID=7936 RepID=A0A0E9USC6_ANGAN